MTKSKKSSSLMSYAGTFGALVILCVVLAIASPNFFKYSNMMSVLKQTSFNALVSTGMLLCLITAGIDLSVGANATFAACLAGTLLQKMDYTGKFFPGMDPLNPFLVLAIVMIVCAIAGAITGAFIAYLHVPPFIATLAMMEIIYGIGLIYTGASPLGGYTDAYTMISRGKFLGMSWLIWIAIACMAVTWFIFNMTRHGKYMYAIGGNSQAAEVAGVPVAKTIVIIYAKASAYFALAGFMLGAKAGGASINTGLSYEMEGIAACALGGVSVTGGRGKVSCALVGVFVLEVLKAALQYLGVDNNAQYIAIGIVIFIAITLDIRKYVQKK